MVLNLDFTSYPVQYDFIMDPTRYLAFVAGIGTGKTKGIAIKGLLKALANPGSLGTLTAPTYPMLRDTTKRTFFEICPQELVAYRNDTENAVGIYTEGKISEILFRSTSDPDSLRGPNLLWVGMDEAAMSDKIAFLILMGRLRAGDPRAQQLFLGTTPQGFNWIYDYFGPHQADPEYKMYRARTCDNVFLPQEYVKSVYQNFSGQFQKQELDGEFCAYEGLVYDTFSADLHVGVYPFNEKLPIDLTWDFGYPNPEAVLAIQQDAYNNVYVLDEVYRIRTMTEDVVADVKSRLWFPNVIDCIADEARPDMIVRLNELGIPARASQKGKILDGVNTVRSLLGTNSSTQKPFLHVDKRCEMFIREFGLYRWGDPKAENEYNARPIDMHNHAQDAFRYWATLKWNRPYVLRTDKKKPKRRVMGYQLL
jgi:PBSX family phage terminase large subunit